MNESELLAAAEVVGYGAVKYFDLKQHPTTNYVFSYDRMLDTKGSQYIMYVSMYIGTDRIIVSYLILYIGDTAVYLLFAYARLASILRKVSHISSLSIHTYIHTMSSTYRRRMSAA